MFKCSRWVVSVLCCDRHTELLFLVRLFLHSSLSKCSRLLQDCSRVPQPAGPADARGAAHRGEEAAASSLFRADVISSIS